MPRSVACGAIAALLIVASLTTPTDALKAHFRRADIPDVCFVCLSVYFGLPPPSPLFLSLSLSLDKDCQKPPHPHTPHQTQGGFSKRGREAAAARKGKTETGDEKYLTEDDAAASSSTRRRRNKGGSDPYDAYVRHRQGKSPGWLAFLVVACGGLWYVWTTGGGPAAVARVRALLRGGGGVGGGGAGLQRAGERLAKRAAAAEASMTGVFATAAGAVAARQQAGSGGGGGSSSGAAQQPDSEQLRQARVRRYAKDTREDIVGAHRGE